MPRISINIDNSVYQILKSVSKRLAEEKGKKIITADLMNIILIGGLLSLTVDKWEMKEYNLLSKFYDTRLSDLEWIIEAIAG